MILLICKNELLKNFHSFLFIALLAVTVFLFILNPFLSFMNYEEKLQEYNQRVKLSQESDKTQRIATFRQPNPLSFIAKAGSDESADTYMVSLAYGISGGIPNDYKDDYKDQIFPCYQIIDWIFILKVLFSLFAILLTFSSISGEKESGTLALISSNSVSKSSIIIGKYFGALITVIIPAIMGMLISTIIVILLGKISLTMEFIYRLSLVAVASFIYISLFVLMGITVSSIVHRSSVSLLLLLSLWIFFVIVVPNIAGIIAEGFSKAESKFDLIKRNKEFDETVELLNFIKTRGLKAPDRFNSRGMDELSNILSRKFAELHNEGSNRRINIMDSYSNMIFTDEDLAFTRSKISPASLFEFAVQEIVDNGVMSQRRFYKSARTYYDLYDFYIQGKTGKVQKYPPYPFTMRIPVQGQIIFFASPKIENFPTNTSDFPAPPRFYLSVHESVKGCLWDITLLVIWNVLLFLTASLYFMQYDVR